MASSLGLRAPRIALLSGSVRKGSFNTKLIGAAERALQRIAADTSGVEATVVDLGKFDLPVYNEDLEGDDGAIPAGAQQLKSVLSDADAFVISSPEYNGWPSAVLINAFTWASRGDAPGAMYGTFAGKYGLVLSTSPGPLGGMRSLDPSRQMMSNLGVEIVPGSVAIGGAYKAFDPETGDLVDEKQTQLLDGALTTLFVRARAQANHEVLGQMVRAHIAGEYGSISLPEDK